MKLFNERDGKPVVLIADDDPTTRLIAREVLEQAGIVVVEARDGKEAIRLFTDVSPDAILLDVDMPHRDGFSVCQMIRAGETDRSIPICMITGLDDFESADKAYCLGATDFISKPIDWSVLAYRLRHLLRSSNDSNEMQGLLSALPDVIFVLDEKGRKYDRPTGLDRKKVLGQNSLCDISFEQIFTEDIKEKVLACVSEALKSSEPNILEHSYAAGKMHLETRFVARDRNTVLAIVRDITQRKRSESQVFNLAHYDRLTGLPNRHLFSEEVERIIEESRNNNRKFAMMFVDLDRFKRINDTLGHSMGDELLKAVGMRLRGCTRSNDGLLPVDEELNDNFKLARLGGDEFVIIFHDIGCEQNAATIALRITDALSAPFSCQGRQLVVTPSIGIAFYPKDGQTKDELLMNADSAMYRAKTAGRNTHQFYSGAMKLKSLQRLSIEEELRKAIREQQFEIYYQPKVDLATWSIVGAEALLRWNHAEQGWISPVDFIPVAEESGLILPLGAWVIQAACQQLMKWQYTPLGKLAVSVNVSSHQLYSDELLSTVEEQVTMASISADKLELEITESMLMRDIEATISTLVSLKEFGVGLSIDDFGTGYSSLSYLKRFPIDALKIDRSFVKDLQCDNDDAAICAAILAMAQTLDLKVVAEGVELDAQVDFLRSRGCDQIQGYLFSKPIPANEFERLFLNHQSSSASGDGQVSAIA